MRHSLSLSHHIHLKVSSLPGACVSLFLHVKHQRSYSTITAHFHVFFPVFMQTSLRGKHLVTRTNSMRRLVEVQLLISCTETPPLLPKAVPTRHRHAAHTQRWSSAKGNFRAKLEEPSLAAASPLPRHTEGHLNNNNHHA